MADAEIDAMGAVAAALTDLDDQARGRVIRWAAERYAIVLAPARRAGRAEEAKDPLDDPASHDSEEELDADGGAGGRTPKKFEHFAELYDAVSPTSDPERVLVASYWAQIVNGKTGFGSQQLNKDLKDLGHAVGTINKAMAANMRKKPALILQVARGGSSQQARKTYKLSDAGRKWVEAKLS